jgi:beta-galactosidase
MQTRLDVRAGCPVFLVDGKPAAPMLFWGADEPFLDTVRLGATYGFHFHSAPMAIPWPEPAQAQDFGEVDAQMARLLEADPQALFLPRIWVEPPGWWAQAHPDQMRKWESGAQGDFVSVASERWKRDLREPLTGLVRHLEEKWGDHILGYHPSGQSAGEWFWPQWVFQERGLMDFEEVFADGFRRWVHRKYGTPEAVTRAWGEQVGRFEDIRLPTAEERRTAKLGAFRDPQRERRMLDFTEYEQAAMLEALENAARICREASGGRKLIYAFYGYTFEQAGTMWGAAPTGHLGLRQLLDDGLVDVICAPISYFDRQLGGSMPVMAPVDSIVLHGRAWLNEDDTRTHLAALDAGFGRVDTPQQTRWVHTRNVARSIEHRSHMWFMDQGQRWLESADIWEHLARLRRLYEQVYARPSPFRSDVAVLVNERSLMAMAYGTQVTRPLIYEMRAQINRMGTPAGLWLLSDFVDGKVPPAKVYLFLNAFWLDEAQRKAIRSHLQGSGATAVWFYAPGYLDQVASVDKMRELTGLPIRQLEGPHALRAEVVHDASTLTRSLEGKLIGTEGEIAPAFAVGEAEGVQVLARYPDTGEALVACRDVDGFRSIYVGTLTVPARLLANIARAAGVHLWADPGDVVITDGRVIGLIASSAGTKTLRFPQRGTARDALTGEVLCSGGRHVSIAMQPGETKMLVYEADEGRTARWRPTGTLPWRP